MFNASVIQDPAEITRLIRKALECTELPFIVTQTGKEMLGNLKTGREQAIGYPCEIRIPHFDCHLEIPWVGLDSNRQSSLLYLRRPAQESGLASVSNISDILPYAVGLHQLQAFSKELEHLDPRSKQTGNPGLQVTQNKTDFGWCLTNRDSDHKVYLRLIQTKTERKDPWLPDTPEPEVEWMLTGEEIWNNNYILKMQVGESPARMQLIAQTLLVMACKKLRLQIVEPFDPFEL